MVLGLNLNRTNEGSFNNFVSKTRDRLIFFTYLRLGCCFQEAQKLISNLHHSVLFLASGYCPEQAILGTFVWVWLLSKEMLEERLDFFLLGRKGSIVFED